MINLTSTDYLTVNTDAAGAIDVHVSWVDQNGTTFTPGNTNTTITTIASTTVLASPAASTLRNAKFISVKNTSASVANGVIISVEDGTNAWPLYFAPVLAAGESITFFDGRGWERYNSNGIPVVIGNTGPVDVQTFTAAGSSTWTKPTAFVAKQVLVKIWGPGGGGGGGGAVAFATACKGGAGGGGGACAVKYFLASELASTVVVSLGSGGSGGIGNLSAAGSPGGNGTVSTFGSSPTLLSASGGGGGAGGAISGATTVSGGGGGTGTAAVLNAAGLPTGAFDGGGGTGVTTTLVSLTEFGGNMGVGTAAASFNSGTSTGVFSLFGGSGGGAAGFRAASGSAVGPNVSQQACGRFPGGAGVTNAVPTAGAAGAPANSIWGGSGGGAGGNSNKAAVNGGAGGAGGQGGGGGGGGGLTIAGNTGGAGGIGGKGYCVVISW